MELTLPGFVTDVCSSIHTLGVGSPFFRTLPLEQYGLAWIHPTLPLAHPFDDGTAAALERSVTATGATLGCDARAYRRLMEPLASNWSKIAGAVLGPLRLPSHPFALARFGLSAMCSAQSLVKPTFKG